MEKIEEARQALALRDSVDPQYVVYIGSSDMSWKGDGFVQYNFNILDENHSKFKSTVAQNSWTI